MCGLFGWHGRPDAALGRRLRDGMAHRGPDDATEWSDAESGIWLGHRRLAIVDLSPNGAQPMLSHTGRYVLAYNGEVYNKDALRAEAEAKGIAFRGHSDTEAMLAAIELHGLRGAVERFVGMFAFALWDRERRELWLARDRLGIKPVYWAQAGEHFAFASELDALRRLDWVDGTIDRAALASYFRHLAVPAPRTIIAGAAKLLPGSLLCWDGHNARSEAYWSVADVVATAEPFAGSFEEATEALDRRLTEAVRLRLMSDAPLGAFLSGGIDSSTVTALMAKTAGQTIDSYTIGFDEPSHDESAHARAIAAHLGTRHHEERLTAADVQALVPESARFHDEPFADSSSLPTFLLSRFARRHVTVALSGDGGDELFGGYPRYFWADRILAWRRRLTPAGAAAAGAALAAVPDVVWDRGIASLTGGRYGGSEGLSGRVARLAGYLRHDPGELHETMTAAWRDPAALVGVEPGHEPPRFPALGWGRAMMAADQADHLPNDLLTKLDRASMAVSLEARVPLLDHRVVEFAWTLPDRYLFAPRGDRGKLILRAVLRRYVPDRLIDRPKMGFGTPMASWLRGPLRDWAETLLAPARLAADGMIDAALARQAWERHLTGENRLAEVWSLLMYLAWRVRTP
jgi:asparagine synthase (glutamine-hydrolysing)